MSPFSKFINFTSQVYTESLLDSTAMYFLNLFAPLNLCKSSNSFNNLSKATLLEKICSLAARFKSAESTKEPPLFCCCSFVLLLLLIPAHVIPVVVVVVASFSCILLSSFILHLCFACKSILVNFTVLSSLLAPPHTSIASPPHKSSSSSSSFPNPPSASIAILSASLTVRSMRFSSFPSKNVVPTNRKTSNKVLFAYLPLSSSNFSFNSVSSIAFPSPMAITSDFG
mmetsp:Transcript_3/g.9  ORF Transcript_3/g.9 Transcript_3/m.9 type:complete len:227 (+) Transcript_3:2274-2954(+)